MKITTNNILIAIIAGLILLVGIATAESDMCSPLPNSFTVTYTTAGTWYNFTITAPTCYVCTDNGAGYGDVDCVPCGNTFSSNVTCGVGTFDVLFHGAVVGMNATGYYWEFGDGGNSTDLNPVHTYTSTGMYNVNFMADLGAGVVSWYNKTNYMTARPAGDTCDQGIMGTGADEGAAYLGVAVLVAIILFGWFRSRGGKL